MSLGLLAPAVLALGVLLLGPLLAHLAKRHPRDRRPFGAMFLLLRLQARLQRRTRIQDALLLALRLAAVGLVVLAAARPELRRVEGAASVGGTGRVIVILDVSLSMDQRDAGDSVFALARRAAAEQLRALPAGIEVAVITCGDAAQVVTGGMTEDIPLAAAILESVEQSYGVTDLHGALVAARTLLGGEPGEILVYTDESGPGVIEAAEPDLDRLLELGSSVIPRVFAPAVRRNVAPVEASYGDGIEGGSVSVRLVNYGPDAKEVPATVYLPDGAQMTAFVEVPGASEKGPGTAEERYTVPRQAQGGVARVVIDDPDLPMDDTRWFHLPRVGASRVLVVDGDPGSSPTRSEVYFLERALSPWGTGGPSVDVVSPSGIGTLDPARHRVVFLANVQDPGPAAPSLVDFVRRGGGLVIAMGDNVTGERYNGPLASILPAPLRRPRDRVDYEGAGGGPLALPDVLGEELFRVFARDGREAFGRVRSRRVMTVDPPVVTDGVRVLLGYADGTPALMERRIGNGRVLLWTSTLDLGWTNLPLQSLFMPLTQRMTAYLGGETGSSATTGGGIAGETLTLPIPPGAEEPEIVGPDGGTVASERTTGALTFTPVVPGAYSAQAADRPPVAWVAVNTASAESDVRHQASILATQARLAPDRMIRRSLLTLPTMCVAFAAMLAASVIGRGRVLEEGNA